MTMLEYYSEREDAPQGLEQLLSEVALACAQAEGLEIPVFAALRLIGDEEIHQVNLVTRGVDRPTDVLSFPTVNYPKGTAKDNVKRVRREYDPEAHASFLGDILISLPRARAQAEEYGHSLRRELCYLTAHAMFHLMGYDHMNDEEKAVMREMEEKALRLLAPRDDGEDEKMTDQKLYEMACDMLKYSYSPYSHCKVGAALLCEDGSVVTGVNVENASYGATICAERSAVFAAVSQGKQKFVKIAIAGSSWVAWPCGMCRQVLAEFTSPSFEVIAGEDGKPFQKKTLGELLPMAFGPEEFGV